MFDRELSSTEKFILWCAFSVPALFIGYQYFSSHFSHQNIEEMIASNQRSSIREILTSAGPDHLIFQNYGNSKIKNALGVAAVECKQEIVEMFFNLSENKMSESYINNASMYFTAHSPISGCPNVRKILAK